MGGESNIFANLVAFLLTFNSVEIFQLGGIRPFCLADENDAIVSTHVLLLALETQRGENRVSHDRVA